MRESRRYLGLDLAGAKNEKTALAVLEYYPTEGKIFLLDCFDRIAPHDDQSGDEALYEAINEFQPGIARMGVSVPLTLPPCLSCTKGTCSLGGKCKSAPVRWMRAIEQKHRRRPRDGTRFKPATAYTQRPIELWVRYQILPNLMIPDIFEIDETLGGNKAPLTARMQFLKRHLSKIPIVETWPKLSVALLAEQNGLAKKYLETYRHLEQGPHSRMAILEMLSSYCDVFMYERDQHKVAQSIGAFDAIICAYTALLADTGRCEKPPGGFPVASGWVEYPAI